MSEIKYIFFDFDGVLAESVNIKTEAFRLMYLKYGDDFANKVVAYHEANGGVSRFEKFKIFNGEWLGEAINEVRIAKLAEEFSSLVVDGVVNSKEVDGTSEFLNSSENYIKYIITGTPTVEMIPILEKRNMIHYFRNVYGSPNKKDYWVKKILDDEQISPEHCIFIGDAKADYDAALNNNITFILRETNEGAKVFENYKGLRLKTIRELHVILQNI